VIRRRELLLDALLDRLGALQAQALLASLDRWLSADAPQPNTKRFDDDQIRVIEGPYDRRKNDGNATHPRRQKDRTS
jgi:hypothetical protein